MNPTLPTAMRGRARVTCRHCGPLGVSEEHGTDCPRYPNALRSVAKLPTRREWLDGLAADPAARFVARFIELLREVQPCDHGLHCEHGRCREHCCDCGLPKRIDQ